jgi:predicted ATPase
MIKREWYGIWLFIIPLSSFIIKKREPNMKIINLTIQGYRSLKNISWKPGNLNVLIGPNGSGKSNLLRVLELITISSKGQLGKYIQRSGGMEPLVWDGISDSIRFNIKSSKLLPSWFTDKNWLTYGVELSRLGKSGAYSVGEEKLLYFHRKESETSVEPFTILDRHKMIGRIFDENRKELIASEESMLEEETLLSLTAGPFAINQHIPIFRQQLAEWCIYHDIDVSQSARLRQPTVARMEKRVDGDGQNLISVLHTLYTGDRQFKNDINLAMTAAFGDDFEELVFPPASDQRVQLRIRWKSLKREQTAADLSDGTLRFLFLLTALATPSPPPLIAIDEPETGLHPAMLPIIAEYAVDAAEKTQIIFTTHSPQFLNAFDETKPQITIVKWHEGETEFLDLDEKSLSEWLREYTLGSLFSSGELESTLTLSPQQDPSEEM